MDPQTTDQVTNSSPADTPVQEPTATPVDTAREQVVTQLQNSKNVLVTVGTDPSVDELASAIGLTLLLTKTGKHVTAVFSGNVPPAIEFLDPEATFEDSVDSLRDFIIALSKEKADKLRYKVEGDVVKIFITPYKTILSEKDLEFSQGELNVDVVVVLGATKSEDLDKALAAHGRILHDASTITINAGSEKSNLGGVNWNEPAVSSVAEMLAGLSEALGADLLDEQSSTALLTGIVAETNRFSNEKTTPRVMTISAQLMAAGANQQLVASNLRQEGMISEPVRTKDQTNADDDQGEMILPRDREEIKDDSDFTEADSKKSKAVKKPKKATNVETSKANDKADSKKPVVTPSGADDAGQEQENNQEEPLKEPAAVLKEKSQLPALPPLDEAPRKIAPVNEEVSDTAQLPSISPLPALSNDVSSVPPVTSPLSEPLDQPPVSTELPNPSLGVNEPVAAGSAQADVSQPSPAILTHDQPLVMDSNETALEEARQAVENAGEAPPPDEPTPEKIPEPAPTPLIDPNPGGSVSQERDAPLAFTAPPLNFPTIAPDSGSMTPSPTEEVAPSDAVEQNPVDAFMQPHNDNTQPVDLNALTSSTAPAPVTPDGLPPLPPLPSSPTDGALPPLPPMPEQPGTDPAAAFQPQINPGFMQDAPQSQNNWSQAADDLAANEADKTAQRDAKKAEMDQQYDRAVDRNRELQGLPPLNDPNGSGLPPVPPPSL